MIDGNEFHHAVLANPDDDQARLVYADWLDQNGQGPRAEFIRVQCHLAKLPADSPHQQVLREREVDLLKTHQDQWLGPAAELVKTHRFRIDWRRGMPELVKANKASNDDMGLFTQVDGIRVLNLAGTRVSQAGLERLPGELTLYNLNLSRTQLKKSGLECLTHMTALRELRLGGTGVVDQTLRPLTSMPWLTELWLPSTQIGNEATKHIALLPHLRSLNLSNNQEITDTGLPPLGELTELENLQLWGTKVTDQGLAHLAALHSLQSLSLGRTEVTEAGLRHITDLPGLTRLNLSETSVTSTTILRLKQARPELAITYLEN